MGIKFLRKTVVFCVTAAAAAGILCGCAASQGKKALEEAEILPISNHLEAWEEELPRDTQDGVFSAAGIRGLSVCRDGETVFAVSYEPREEKDSFDYWDISVPYRSLVSVNTEELYQLFEAAVQAVISKDAGISMKKAGLNESDTSIFIAYNDQQKDGQKGSPEPTAARKLLIGKEDGKGHYYMAEDGRDQVHLADKSMIDAVLNADSYQYILKLPVLISVNSVSQVNVCLDGSTHVMKRAEDWWKLDEKDVDRETFQELYGKLLGITVTEELTGNKKLDADREPVLMLQFLRNVEGASDIEVKYYEYDDEHMSVSVNGQERFLVQVSEVSEVIDIIEAGF